ncbi:hypothetical protein HMPREF1991_00374 [Hoylesella loescheii DSM 19665 = JCM 12249 = ATCC 15930]|uniref:Uncharacterized protein n=1 Tax=Hoylesella loescheii DSM 19665 = JCM 12249 = ATCC 15930 TaxID=1122985 RepID=A0A069QNK1_HOYLO|nr:hypothetical protein HMPREF1991_00374 [Hoylesella loescheii DSM 19665 = JCM 12249 = ATCC 15930]
MFDYARCEICALFQSEHGYKCSKKNANIAVRLLKPITCHRTL